MSIAATILSIACLSTIHCRCKVYFREYKLDLTLHSNDIAFVVFPEKLLAFPKIPSIYRNSCATLFCWTGRPRSRHGEGQNGTGRGTRNGRNGYRSLIPSIAALILTAPTLTTKQCRRNIYFRESDLQSTLYCAALAHAVRDTDSFRVYETDQEPHRMELLHDAGYKEKFYLANALVPFVLGVSKFLLSYLS